jgi:hypothetical protein
MRRAGALLTEAAPAARIASVAGTAARALEARAAELDDLLASYPSPDASVDPEGRWMARALDRLEASASGSPELTRARQVRAAAMARARSAALLPGAAAGLGTVVTAPAATAPLGVAPADGTSERSWAALPERMAHELRDAGREHVPEEYRDMVNAYFERIAQEGRN